MFNENITFLGKNSRESDDYAGTSYIDQSWDLGDCGMDL